MPKTGAAAMTRTGVRKTVLVLLIGLVLGVGLGLGVSAGILPRGEDQPAAVPETLVVSFIPLANPEKLAPQAEAIADYLSEKLGLPVDVLVPTEYAPVVEALRSGRAHVAFVGTLAAAMAYRLADAYPILMEIQRGQPFYHSQYYVRAESEIRSLADLAGKAVAYTSPTGGSGFVFPVSMLVDEGLLAPGGDPKGFFREVVFAGGDELVLKAVLRGDVDAGATSDYALDLVLRPDEREQLRAIARIQVPGHQVVVNGSLPHSLVARIQSALLELGTPANRSLLKAVYGADGFVPATLAALEPVVRAAEVAGLDLPRLLHR
jgi:phosphonate transport system substrate-binding protein